MSIKQLPAPVIAVIGACFFSTAAICVDTLKPTEASGAPADPSGKPPFIVHNPDGTFTVQMKPQPGKSENAKQNGLVIPPQVVVPELRASAKDQQN